MGYIYIYSPLNNLITVRFNSDYSLNNICIIKPIYQVVMDHLAKCRSASVRVICLLQGFFIID